MPIQKYKWKLKETAPNEFQTQFPEISPLSLQLLWSRDLRTQKDVDEFFAPDYETDLHDPFLLTDMQKTVDRLFEARANNERIVVYGDYDVDGMTGTAILLEAFELLGIRGEGFIPNRYQDGYGVTAENVDRFVADGIDIMITVDCGISNAKQIEHANSKGLLTIITDHHHIPESIPNAFSIIHPLLPNSEYPYKWLTGVGVAYKLALALIQEARKKKLVRIPEGWEKWLLDLVVLGTVADCGDMRGENRTLIQYGLKVLRKTRRKGLQQLFRQARIETENVSVEDVMWKIAPRINAPSRVEDPLPSFHLIRAQTDDDASQYSWKLEQYNTQRKNVAEGIQREIEEQYLDVLKTTTLLFAVSTEWREGVLGLVAGRLMDKYQIPCVLLVRKEHGEVLGSIRSPLSFNAIENLSKFKELLLQFGGHAQAAGLSLKEENLELLQERLQQEADKALVGKEELPTLLCDMELESERIDWKLFEQVEHFAPYGRGNEEPLFIIPSLKIVDIRAVGSDQSHLKLSFETKHGKIFPAIAFGNGGVEQLLSSGAIVDVAASVAVNEWNGSRELQLVVKDLKKSVS